MVKPLAVGSPCYAAVAADFGRDGRIDLAAVSVTKNEVYLLVNSGGGVLQPARTLVLPSHAPSSGLVAADVNQDGYPDLIVALSTGLVAEVLLVALVA